MPGELGIENDERIIYDCFAVTNHLGMINAGHYTAYAKNNDIWYIYNDDIVS